MASARFHVLPTRPRAKAGYRKGGRDHRFNSVNFWRDGGAFAQSAYKLSILNMGIYFDKIANANSLYSAFMKCRIDTHWKESVQRYEANLFSNIAALQKKLRGGTYHQLPFVEFDLAERGKRRHIKAMHISDRVVQRSICDNVLIPALGRCLIYDNGASIYGKGVRFARDRLQCHLEKFIRKYGVDGYVLKGDFSKFFDNIDHDLVLKSVAEKIDDPMLMALLDQIVASFRIDASALSEDELSCYETQPVDLLNFPRSDEGRVFINRSLGIGSQVSQILGVYYPTPIDHLVKVRLGCKYYGRYMDDFYIVHNDKHFLEDVLSEIKGEAGKLKLFLNEKKTVISPLHRGFTYMKVKYSVTDSGKIIKRLSPDSFTRERRKLKKYANFVGNTMTRRDVSNAYQSWRGNAINFKSHRSVANIDRLYNKLFVED